MNFCFVRCAAITAVKALSSPRGLISLFFPWALSAMVKLDAPQSFIMVDTTTGWHHILIRWPSGLSWLTGIRNDAPNQEVLSSIPAAGRSRNVFIRGGNSNGFSFRTCLLLLLTFPPTRPHQLCWKYLPSINKAPLTLPFYWWAFLATVMWQHADWLDLVLFSSQGRVWQIWQRQER